MAESPARVGWESRGAAFDHKGVEVATLSSVPLERALSLVPDGARIVASPGCGGPSTLLEGLGTIGCPGSVHLYSGLQLDGYPFLRALDAGTLTYTTWHVMSVVRARVASGQIGYVPARASEVPALLELWDTNVAFVRVSPPGPDGSFSLGPSVSYPAAAVGRAAIVIAEVDETLPYTCGCSSIPSESITALVESTTPTPTYRAAPLADENRAIATNVIDLLPRNPVLQVGIGGVPEALVSLLGEADLGVVRFVGMGSDPMVELFLSGVCDPTTSHPDPALLAVELMGSSTLLAYSHRNPAICVYPSTYGHAPAVLSALDRLVSVNAAIEVDLSGQVNSEVAGGRQLSGVGGSVDFVEAAFRSDGGRRITVMPSMTTAGKSRIVGHIGADGVVTTPRCATDAVVTEYGVAELRGRTLAQRSDALIAVAHPDCRDALADGVL